MVEAQRCKVTDVIEGARLMSGYHEIEKWNRREWLAAGCALAGSLGLNLSSTARGSQASAPETGGPYAPFKMGLQSYSLRGLTKNGQADLAMALAATKDLGLHYWESYPAHVPAEGGARRVHAIKEDLAIAGVSVIGYGVVPFKKDIAANEPMFAFAKAMGIQYLSADPDPDAFDSLDKLVEKYGIAVGIHNHGPGHRYDKIETIANAIKNHHEKIGCCVDTGHFLRSKIDPVDAVEAFGKRVYGVHLKDVKDAKTFTILGQGDLRTVDLLKVLARNKYNYCLAIEYEEKPENPVADIKACLVAAQKAAAEARKA